MLAERRDADDGVVAPVGTFVALPPGLACRPGSHASAHAELEQARESRRCGKADGQVLHDCQTGIGLDRRKQAQDCGGRHFGVGVERQHELEPLGVVVEEIHDIAGLEAGIVRSSPIADAGWITVLSRESCDRLFFVGGARDIGIGQDEQRESIACAGSVQIVQQAPQWRQHAVHIFVAYRHCDRRARHGAWREGWHWTHGAYRVPAQQ